jgi:hypothetical protein
MRKVFSKKARSIRSLSTARYAAVVAGAMMLWSFPSYAHHSYSAFDMEVTHTVSGTLKEFLWVAPHAELKVTYLNDQHVTQEIPISTGSPVVLGRQGFKAEDFVAGSKVTMSWHPNRDGTLGGELAELKLEDGRVLYGHGAGPAGAGGPPPGGPPNGLPPG